MIKLSIIITPSVNSDEALQLDKHNKYINVNTT